MQTHHAASRGPPRAARPPAADVSLLILFVALAGLVAGPRDGEPVLRGLQGCRRRSPSRRHLHRRGGRHRRAGGRRLAAERVIPCGGFVGNLLMRGTGKSRGDPRRDLPPHDRDDPRRRRRGAHDAPEAGPHGRRADPARVSASRRSPTRVEESLGIPAERVPRSRATRASSSPRRAARRRVARGVPVARDVPSSQAGRRRRRDPASARPVHARRPRASPWERAEELV